MKLGLERVEFDRAHRIGPKYIKDGRDHQQVIVKLISWDARNTIYEARKDSFFKFSADLTNERSNLLKLATEHAKDFDCIDFVFVDRNCRLMVRSKEGKFYSFSHVLEFISLANWIEAGNDDEERHDKRYVDYLEKSSHEGYSSVSVENNDEENVVDNAKDGEDVVEEIPGVVNAAQVNDQNDPSSS